MKKYEVVSKLSKDGNILPVLPLRGFVMFPRIVLNFDVSREKSILAVEEAMKTKQMIFIVTQKGLSDDRILPDDLNNIGIIAELKQLIHQQGNPGLRVLAEGITRARVTEYLEGSPYVLANVIPCEDIIYEETPTIIALTRKAKELFEEYLSFLSKTPADLIMGTETFRDPGELCDYIASNIVLSYQDKQTLLEELDTKKRIKLLLKMITSEIEIMDIENDIGNKLKDSIDKGQKDYFLREQIKIISQELGEDDNPQTEAVEYKKKLEKFKLPKDIHEKLLKECDRFSKIPPGSSESNVSRGYIETCISLPWNKRTKDNIDLEKAKKVLDEKHFGLKEVKDRIIESLAVKKLSKQVKGQIICLEGPPGVGKTSIAKSIAEAMGRKYVRVSLGGIKDESEIRGHRRTYIGSMPGRIIAAVKQSKVKNPLILLDEIDKLSKDYHGDPSAALLEALDPEQNNSFYDHYIDFPFDLSEVLFITTANDKNQIPRPLYDRMEIITLYSYTHEEKFNIAKRHLISKQLKNNGLDDSKFSINDEALRMLIDAYTKEAGVRGLEKKIASLMRRAAREIVSKDAKTVLVDKLLLKKMLGPEKYKNSFKYKSSEIGVVKGLAWTSAGGETMPIEVALMKGKGKVQITGSLGNVMKESAQIAVSYIRSNSDKLGIKQDFYNKMDIHIHAPEGAIPKDGPSAGVTMTTALVSALSEVPVRQDVAMTGEVTLKGKVLPIGGLKEKTMAAYRDGVSTVIIPSDNRSDIQDIDEVVKKSLKFVMAEDLDTVFKYSLDTNSKNLDKVSKGNKNMQNSIKKTNISNYTSEILPIVVT